MVKASTPVHYILHIWHNNSKGYVYNTEYSQAVTHPSTNSAQCCLTAVIGRELVFSTWYGRKHDLRAKLFCYSWASIVKLHERGKNQLERYIYDRFKHDERRRVSINGHTYQCTTGIKRAFICPAKRSDMIAK